MATGFFQYVQDTFLNTVLPVSYEAARLLPDSLLFGTGLLSLVTYQTPMMFLFLTVALSFVASNLVTGSVKTFIPEVMPSTTPSDQCYTGLFSATPMRLRLSLLKEFDDPCSGFPNASMFILSSFIFYCIGGVLQQADVLAQLGPDFQAKMPAICVLSALLLIIFTIYLLKFGCSGFLTVLFSVGAGAMLGGVLSVVYSLIFGQESINILGLPLFVKRDETGQPLYICATRDRVQ